MRRFFEERIFNLAEKKSTQNPGASGQRDPEYRVTALHLPPQGTELSHYRGTEGADQVSLGEGKRRREDEETRRKSQSVWKSFFIPKHERHHQVTASQ